MHPKPSIRRTLAAGLAGGAAFVLGTFVTFAQLGGARRGEEGLLFDPDTQHAKVIAVWKQIEPLPRVIETPAVILVGMVAFGIAYALLYRSVASAWPAGIHRRAWRLALVVWLATVFSEFHGPVQRATPAAVAQRRGVGVLGCERRRRGVHPGLCPRPRPVRTHRQGRFSARRATRAAMRGTVFGATGRTRKGRSTPPDSAAARARRSPVAATTASAARARATRGATSSSAPSAA